MARAMRAIVSAATTNVVIFVLAAFFEIAGCFAFWMSLRRGATPLMAVLGVGSLMAFPFALGRTRCERCRGSPLVHLIVGGAMCIDGRPRRVRSWRRAVLQASAFVVMIAG
jgi:hypothetical protein